MDPTVSSAPEDQHDGALAGARIAVTGNRKGAQLASLLERRGAAVLLGPTLEGDVPTPDDEVLADTRRILDAAPGWLVASTGVGIRLWADVADRAGVGDDLRRVAERARCVARGPKAVGGLAALGVKPTWVAPQNTDQAVAQWLQSRLGPEDVVAVQLHGGASRAYDELRDTGAALHTVMPYRWQLPADPEPARAVIRAAVDGELDVITFTSAGAVSNLFALAAELGGAVAAELRTALAGPVAVASVGPVTAEAVEAHGGVNVVVPDRWRTADLVRETAAWWQDR
jgi:uroporphyrinogen-III synthase